ncbi:MAG TPA: DinB family protein, partial [Thermoanaerobaculia bacterium]|nr:DinB family protein [Thermoanaerobaculia bacterium]
SQANERQAADIVAEYAAVREATIALFRGLPEAAMLRSGVADGKRSTVRALGYHIAGHEAHHLGVVEERYLGRKRR